MTVNRESASSIHIAHCCLQTLFWLLLCEMLGVCLSFVATLKARQKSDLG